MSHNIPIEQAATQLSGLVHAMRPGDEIVLTDNNLPIARILPVAFPQPRTAGTCRGMLEILSDDAADALGEFQDYLP